jgi:preprotein translocase subunit SecG
MYILLIIIHVIVSLVLIAVILLQAGRGGSLAETFGGGAAQNLFGTSASKVLTKATTVCAITFILTSIALGILSARKSESLMKSVVATENKPAPAKTMPTTATAQPPASTTAKEVKPATASTTVTATPSQSEQTPVAPTK